MRFTKKWVLVTLIGVAVLAYFAASTFRANSVAVISPQTGPAVEAIYATGTVEASVMLPIAPRSAARLMQLNVDEGSTVTKDQVMGQLEDTDIEKTVQELQAREVLAKREYNRRAVLIKTGAISKGAYDQARAEWDASKAALARAEAQQNFLRLIAPENGLVIKRDGEVGQLIPANQPVFWISCCAPLRITADVDEENITDVKPGQKVLIHSDAFAGKVFNGTVQAITPKGDPIARSYRVRIGFTEEVPLMIGMTAETNIVLHESKDALLVPLSAVKNNSLLLVRDGKIVKQKVTVGARDKTRLEIREGLTKADVVVKSYDSNLIEGASVRTHQAKIEKEQENP
jgi:RND family efflux transporter MFP subunit